MVRANDHRSTTPMSELGGGRSWSVLKCPALVPVAANAGDGDC